jgi:hypothetical protein
MILSVLIAFGVCLFTYLFCLFIPYIDSSYISWDMGMLFYYFIKPLSLVGMVMTFIAFLIILSTK